MHPWLVMDVPIVLSLVNTKLRNTGHRLAHICEDEAVDQMQLEKRLAKINYVYHALHNQFVFCDSLSQPQSNYSGV